MSPISSQQTWNLVDSPTPANHVSQALSSWGFESTDPTVLNSPLSTEGIKEPSDRSEITTDDNFIITETHWPEKGAQGLEADGPAYTVPCHCHGMAITDCQHCEHRLLLHLFVELCFCLAVSSLTRKQ